MSTPPMPDPRLADPLEADGEQPDLERDNVGEPRPRIDPAEAEERIPEPDE